MSQQSEVLAPVSPEQLAEIARTAKALQAALLPGGPALPRPVREFGDAMTPDAALALVGRLSELESQLAAAEARATGLQTELAEQEREKLALVQEVAARKGDAEPGGDGGIWALQRLAHYCRQAGHYSALDNIRAAGHNLGWCLDDGGADKIDPTDGICPLCDYDSEPRPAPFERPTKPSLLCSICGEKHSPHCWPFAPSPAAPTLVGDETPAPVAGWIMLDENSDSTYPEEYGQYDFATKHEIVRGGYLGSSRYGYGSWYRSQDDDKPPYRGVEGVTHWRKVENEPNPNAAAASPVVEKGPAGA